MKAWSLLLPMVIGLHVFAQTPCNTSGPVRFEDHEKWGYLSARGIVIPPRFDLAGLFTADGAIACVANQGGLLGRDGSFVAPTWNRQSRPFPENYAEGLAPASGVMSTAQETLLSRSNSSTQDSSMMAWQGQYERQILLHK